MNQDFTIFDEEEKQQNNQDVQMKNENEIQMRDNDQQLNQNPSSEIQNESHHSISIDTNADESHQQNERNPRQNQIIRNIPIQNIINGNERSGQINRHSQLNDIQREIDRIQHQTLDILNDDFQTRRIQRVKCFDIWFRLYIIVNLMAFFLFNKGKFSGPYYFLFIAITSLGLLAQKCGIFMDYNNHDMMRNNSFNEHYNNHRHRSLRNRQQLNDLISARRQLQQRLRTPHRRNRRTVDIISQLDDFIPQRMDIIQIGRRGNNRDSNIETRNSQILRPQLQLSINRQDSLHSRNLARFEQSLENLRNRQRLGDENNQYGEITLLLNQMLTGQNILQIIEHLQSQSQQNNGLTQEQIDKVSIITLCEEKVEKLQACSICLIDFEKENQARMLPCDHGFHVNCIDVWLKQQNMCPNCRHKVVEQESQ